MDHLGPRDRMKKALGAKIAETLAIPNPYHDEQLNSLQQDMLLQLGRALKSATPAALIEDIAGAAAPFITRLDELEKSIIDEGNAIQAHIEAYQAYEQSARAPRPAPEANTEEKIQAMIETYQEQGALKKDDIDKARAWWAEVMSLVAAAREQNPQREA